MRHDPYEIQAGAPRRRRPYGRPLAAVRDHQSETRSHKFKLGQRVKRVIPVGVNDKTGFGEFAEIVRLMPEDQTGEVSYRIRSGEAERAVREDEIEPAAEAA